MTEHEKKTPENRQPGDESGRHIYSETPHPMDQPAPAPHEEAEQVLTPENYEHAHPADLAEHIENAELPEQLAIVSELKPEDAAHAIVEMDEHAALTLVSGLDPEQAGRIVAEMSPDDAADLLSDLPRDFRRSLLTRLPEEEAAEITHLMRYDPDTAGGVMNTEVVVLDQGLTADQAISIIRKDIAEMEVPYYAYLVDESDTLTGVVSLREMLVAKPGTMLRSLIRHQSLVSVSFDVDKEDVARQLSHYNWMAMPVVDYQGRLLGVVTHDDIIDILQEEHTEDMQAMVGAGGDESVDTPWVRSVKQRLPWLFINVVNSAIAAWVVHLFEGTIAQMAILAALMHIVSNQAGNTGQQSLAVIIRQMAMEKYERGRFLGALWRELKVGIANGLVVGLVVFLLVLAVMQDVALSTVMGLALGSNMFLGALAGAAIPMVLKELGRDPALASSIFLTTITDSSGFFIFLGLAGAFLL